MYTVAKITFLRHSSILAHNSHTWHLSALQFVNWFHYHHVILSSLLFFFGGVVSFVFIDTEIDTNPDVVLPRSNSEWLAELELSFRSIQAGSSPPPTNAFICTHDPDCSKLWNVFSKGNAHQKVRCRSGFFWRWQSYPEIYEVSSQNWEVAK